MVFRCRQTRKQNIALQFLQYEEKLVLRLRPILELKRTEKQQITFFKHEILHLTG